MTCAERPTRLLPAIALALALGGCTMTEVRNDIAAAKRESEAQSQAMRMSGTSGAVTRTAHPRVAGEDVVLRRSDDLPEVFSNNVMYVTAGQSLAQILDTLSSKSGIPMRVVKVSSDAAEGSDAGARRNRRDLLPAGVIALDWRDRPLKGLLDTLAQRTDLFWRRTPDGRVEFFEYETRSFHLHLPIGTRSVSSSIALTGTGSRGGESGGGGSGSSGGGGGGSGATGGTVNVDSSIKIDQYDSIMKSIQSMLGEERRTRGAGGAGAAGSTTAAEDVSGVIGNADLGMITVTARPPVLSRITEYIDSINKRFARNILIDVKVYSVALSRENNAGITMDLLYNRLNRSGLQITGAPMIEGSSLPTQMTFEVLDAASRFSGSRLFAQALAGFGDVSLVTSGQVMAVNGQPSPMQVANEITYLASSSTTQTANAGSTTTLTPGTRVVGFTANFLPMLMGDNRILLQYQMELSALMSLDQISSGDAVIQTPRISTQSLQQQSFVRDGEAIVLFGFEQDHSADNSNYSLFNISRVGRKNRQLMVIVMQVFGGARNGV